MEKNRRAVRSFEDLDVYRLAREFSRRVSELIKMLPKCEDYNLKPQMKRTRLSVTNKIAEGSARYHYSKNTQGFPRKCDNLR